MLINIKTNSAVNVRSGPGMGFEVVNTYPSGYILQAKEMQKDGGDNIWYKVKDGWLSANYTIDIHEQGTVHGERGKINLQQFAPGNPSGAVPLSNQVPKSESPQTDKVISSIAQGQITQSVANPNGGLSSAVFVGGHGNETDVNSDVILNKRIYGVPYQFMDTTDYRPAANNGGDGELGATFMEMMAEAPVLSIIPGKANFLPDLSSEEKEKFIEAANQTLQEMQNRFNDTAQKMIDDKNADMRYFEFVSDHSTYIRYVNTLCQMNAIMMGLGDEYVPGHEGQGEQYKFKYYDWSGYRLSNTMAGRASTGLLNGNESGPGEKIDSIIDYVKSAVANKESLIDKGMAAASALNLTEYYIDFYINPSIGYSESFSNQTKESMISSMVSGMGDLAKELQFLMGAGAVKQDGNMTNSIAKATGEIGEAANKLLPNSGIIKKITGSAASVLSGSNIFFPELWASSDFSRSYTVEMDLKTPYGNKRNIFLDLFVPMWHWIALVAPRQTTINTYGAPFIVRAYIPGMFSSEMSIVENLTIQKGGDGSAWSVDGYPLEIKLSVTLKDLYNTFAMSQITDLKSAYNMLWNYALIDYVSVQSGLDMKLSEFAKKIEVAKALGNTAIRDLWNYPLEKAKERLAQSIRIASGRT